VERNVPRLLRPGGGAPQRAISLVLRRRLALRTALMLAWASELLFSGPFGLFAFEYSSPTLPAKGDCPDDPGTHLATRILAEQVNECPEAARHQVWSTLILVFLRYPQLLGVCVADRLDRPPMLSRNDLRRKALFKSIFHRPLSRGSTIPP